ncbi:MAG: hypothetical protein LBG12_03965 [Synergistaceae bacterium]|jgi:hypothetical protein|nr:hypothetical protein [Synergistaceae bacterium]
MMETVVRLNELVGKKPHMTDRDSREAAVLLLELYSYARDKEMIADFIMNLKPAVCLYFFEKAAETMEIEEIESLQAAVCGTEAYKKNTNRAGTIRGFIFAAVLAERDTAIARAVLMRTLADAEKDGKFSEAVVKSFKTNVLAYYGMEAIEALGDKEWENPEMRDRFARFMQTVGSSDAMAVRGKKSQEPIKTTRPLKTIAGKAESESRTNLAPTVNTHPEAALSPADEKAHSLTAEILKTLESSAREARILLGTLNESNGAIANLRQQITERDSRISELSSALSERDGEIDCLRQDKINAEQTISDKDARISDLREQLRLSMQMDNISQNQELITLKSNLANSLKMEYADYLNSKDSECNSDNYAALIGSLTRIFKTLHRLGITIG